MDNTKDLTRTSFEQFSPDFLRTLKPSKDFYNAPTNEDIISEPYEYNVEGFDSDRYKRLEKRGIAVNPYDPTLDKQLADSQSRAEQFGAFLNQAIVGEIVGGTLQGVGTLLDVGDKINYAENEEKKWTNFLTEAGENLRTWTKEATPVYEQHPGKFNPTSWSWWMANGASVASTLSLMIPGAGVMKGLSYLSKIAKLGQGLQKVGLSANAVKGIGFGASRIGQAFLSRHMENTMEASQNYNETFDKYVDDLGEQRAKELAAESAAFTYRADWAMLGTDILQYSLLPRFNSRGQMTTKVAKALKEGNLTAPAASKIMAKNAATLFGQSAPEAFEEGWQYVAAEEGKHLADTLAGVKDETTFGDRLGEYTKKGEFWSAAFMGVVGGAAFQAAGKPIQKWLAKGPDENDRRAENIRDIPVKLSKFIEDYTKAKENNDTYEMDFLNFQLDANLSGGAILNKNAHHLEEHFQQQIDGLNKAETDQQVQEEFGFNTKEEGLKIYQERLTNLHKMEEKLKEVPKSFGELAPLIAESKFMIDVYGKKLADLKVESEKTKNDIDMSQITPSAQESIKLNADLRSNIAVLDWLQRQLATPDKIVDPETGEIKLNPDRMSDSTRFSLRQKIGELTERVGQLQTALSDIQIAMKTEMEGLTVKQKKAEQKKFETIENQFKTVSDHLNKNLLFQQIYQNQINLHGETLGALTNPDSRKDILTKKKIKNEVDTLATIDDIEQYEKALDPKSVNTYMIARALEGKRREIREKERETNDQAINDLLATEGLTLEQMQEAIAKLDKQSLSVEAMEKIAQKRAELQKAEEVTADTELDNIPPEVLDSTAEETDDLEKAEQGKEDNKRKPEAPPETGDTPEPNFRDESDVPFPEQPDASNSTDISEIVPDESFDEEDLFERAINKGIKANEENLPEENIPATSPEQLEKNKKSSLATGKSPDVKPVEEKPIKEGFTRGDLVRIDNFGRSVQHGQAGTVVGETKQGKVKVEIDGKIHKVAPSRLLHTTPEEHGKRQQLKQINDKYNQIVNEIDTIDEQFTVQKYNMIDQKLSEIVPEGYIFNRMALYKKDDTQPNGYRNISDEWKEHISQEQFDQLKKLHSTVTNSKEFEQLDKQKEQLISDQKNKKSELLQSREGIELRRAWSLNDINDGEYGAAVTKLQINKSTKKWEGLYFDSTLESEPLEGSTKDEVVQKLEEKYQQEIQNIVDAIVDEVDESTSADVTNVDSTIPTNPRVVIEGSGLKNAVFVNGIRMRPRDPNGPLADAEFQRDQELASILDDTERAKKAKEWDAKIKALPAEPMSSDFKDKEYRDTFEVDKKGDLVPVPARRYNNKVNNKPPEKAFRPDKLGDPSVQPGTEVTFELFEHDYWVNNERKKFKGKEWEGIPIKILVDGEFAGYVSNNVAFYASRKAIYDALKTGKNPKSTITDKSFGDFVNMRINKSGKYFTYFTSVKDMETRYVSDGSGGWKVDSKPLTFAVITGTPENRDIAVSSETDAATNVAVKRGAIRSDMQKLDLGHVYAFTTNPQGQLKAFKLSTAALSNQAVDRVLELIKQKGSTEQIGEIIALNSNIPGFAHSKEDMTKEEWKSSEQNTSLGFADSKDYVRIDDKYTTYYSNAVNSFLRVKNDQIGTKEGSAIKVVPILKHDKEGNKYWHMKPVYIEGTQTADTVSLNRFDIEADLRNSLKEKKYNVNMTRLAQNESFQSPVNPQNRYDSYLDYLDSTEEGVERPGAMGRKSILATDGFNDQGTMYGSIGITLSDVSIDQTGTTMEKSEIADDITPEIETLTAKPDPVPTHTPNKSVPVISTPVIQNESFEDTDNIIIEKLTEDVKSDETLENYLDNVLPLSADIKLFLEKVNSAEGSSFKTPQEVFEFIRTTLRNLTGNKIKITDQDIINYIDEKYKC